MDPLSVHKFVQRTHDFVSFAPKRTETSVASSLFSLQKLAIDKDFERMPIFSPLDPVQSCLSLELHANIVFSDFLYPHDSTYNDSSKIGFPVMLWNQVINHTHKSIMYPQRALLAVTPSVLECLTKSWGLMHWLLTQYPFWNRILLTRLPRSSVQRAGHNCTVVGYG